MEPKHKVELTLVYYVWTFFSVVLYSLKDQNLCKGHSSVIFFCKCSFHANVNCLAKVTVTSCQVDRVNNLSEISPNDNVT